MMKHTDSGIDLSQRNIPIDPDIFNGNIPAAVDGKRLQTAMINNVCASAVECKPADLFY